MSDSRQQDPVYRMLSGATMWGVVAVIVAILLIGGLFYGYNSNRTNVASNNVPPADINAAAPAPPASPATPAPAPSPMQRPQSQ